MFYKMFLGVMSSNLVKISELINEHRSMTSDYLVWKDVEGWYQCCYSDKALTQEHIWNGDFSESNKAIHDEMI